MMEGWKEIRLKELISEMGDGGTPSTLVEGNFGGNIPWVVVDDVKPEIYSTKDCLTEQGFKSCSAKMWNEGTIILTTGATIGKVGIAKVPLCTKQGITGIVCNEYANNLFVRYWLEANEEQLLRYAQGTTFKEIRTRPLGNLRIMVPKPFTKESVDEQTAIANILSKVDEAIASVQGSIAAAERLKKSLMQNLLTGRMKPDGTLRKEDEFYMDDEFGKVPMGWSVKKVKECFKFKNGKGNTTNNLREIPDMEYCIPVFGGNGITGYYHSAMLNEPTIVIGRVGEYCGNVFQTPAKSWVTDNAMLVSEVLMKEYDIDFFTLKLNSLNFKQFSDSTGQPKITQGSIGSVLFAYPSNIDEQNGIISLISRVSNKIQQRQNKVATLERLKKSLMQNLLTGKVRVKQ